MVCHHIAKFGSFSHYCIGDMVLICHVISKDHVTQEPCDF